MPRTIAQALSKNLLGNSPDWYKLTIIGFLVVPLLFAYLPQASMAGAMAARLFTAQTWVSCLCALLLLILSRSSRSLLSNPVAQGLFLFIVSSMVLALLSEFAVAPRIVARDNLRFWHAVGSAMYLLQWLCAGVTFWKLTPPS